MEHFSALAGVFVRQKRNFFAERNFFLAARTQISCRKEIPGSVESGEKRGFGPVFPSGWRPPACETHLSFCRLFPSRAARGRHPSARHPAAGGKVSREPGFRLSSCISAGPRGSRISARARPCARPRDSRGAGFDVLTKWYVGTSAACRASGPPGRGKKYPVSVQRRDTKTQKLN